MNDEPERLPLSHGPLDREQIRTLVERGRTLGRQQAARAAARAERERAERAAERRAARRTP